MIELRHNTFLSKPFDYVTSEGENFQVLDHYIQYVAREQTTMLDYTEQTSSGSNVMDNM